MSIYMKPKLVFKTASIYSYIFFARAGRNPSPYKCQRLMIYTAIDCDGRCIFRICNKFIFLHFEFPVYHFIRLKHVENELAYMPFWYARGNTSTVANRWNSMTGCELWTHYLKICALILNYYVPLATNKQFSVCVNANERRIAWEFREKKSKFHDYEWKITRHDFGISYFYMGS